MNIEIRGEGELVIRFIDKQGATLMQERLTVSGSPKMTALRVIDLSLRSGKRDAPVAPVLVSRSNPEQSVLFDGSEPAAFTKRRCKEIGCAAKVANAAGKGVAPEVVTGHQPTLRTDDAVLAGVFDSLGRPLTTR